MGLSKFPHAFLEKQLAFLIANLFCIHAKSELSSTHGLLLEFCSVLPEYLEVEPRFIVLLLPKLVVVREKAASHDDTDTDVDGFGVWDCLTGKVCVLDPISDVADEFLDPIIGMPVHFHAVFVEFAVVLVGFSVKSEELLKYVAEAHVGIADTRRSELFGVEW